MGFLTLVWHEDLPIMENFCVFSRLARHRYYGHNIPGLILRFDLEPVENRFAAILHLLEELIIPDRLSLTGLQVDGLTLNGIMVDGAQQGAGLVIAQRWSVIAEPQFSGVTNPA